MRSRAAAAALSGAGFKDVYSMSGGINAWEGLVAEGAPEAGMAYFSSATTPEELMALAWHLEGATCRFYSELMKRLEDRDAKLLFNELAEAEEHHQSILLKLYKEVTAPSSDPGFPGSVLSSEEDIMEGGVNVADALRWAEGKTLAEILELSLSLETNSFDLYIKMRQRAKDARSAHLFQVLANEERRHLEQLADLLNKKV